MCSDKICRHCIRRAARFELLGRGVAIWSALYMRRGGTRSLESSLRQANRENRSDVRRLTPRTGSPASMLSLSANSGRPPARCGTLRLVVALSPANSGTPPLILAPYRQFYYYLVAPFFSLLPVFSILPNLLARCHSSFMPLSTPSFFNSFTRKAVASKPV